MANKGLGKGLDMLIPKSKAAAKPSVTREEKNSDKTAEEKKTAAADTISTNKGSEADNSLKAATVSEVDNSPEMAAAPEIDNSPTVTAMPEAADNEDGVVTLKIARIEPNREQPRKQFDEAALEELSLSIKRFGVIQPVVVCKKGDFYELIAGERRWRAAKKAGLSEIPAIIREFSDQERTEVSLIENIQRENLNPMEEAAAYKQLIDEYGLTQEQLAERLSKSRTAVTNTMRLLKLGDDVQKMVLDGKLSGGHARALLTIDDPAMQTEAAEKVIKEDLSVRQTEELVKELAKADKPVAKKKSKTSGAKEYRELEARMTEIFGTKVRIHQNEKGRGKIEISYFSEDDLDRIYTSVNSLMEQ